MQKENTPSKEIIKKQDKQESPKKKKTRKMKDVGSPHAKGFVENIPVFLEFLKVCGLEGKLREAAKPPIVTAVTDKSPIVLSKERNLVEIAAPVSPKQQHILSGKHIVMTKVHDKTIMVDVVKVGGIVVDKMSQRVFVLVVKSMHDSSKKMDYAREHGIPMMLPCEFVDKYLIK